MILKIYAQPLWRVFVEIPLCTLLWAGFFAAAAKRWPKAWRGINYCLLAASVFAVILTTILRRNAGEYGLILTPGYFLQEAKIEPQIYRSLLMNVLLFTPFGMGLGAVLYRDNRSWRSVLLTVSIAFVFSICVETTQYFAKLGRAEADDVLANSLGAFIGALHVPIGAALMKRSAGRNK